MKKFLITVIVLLLVYFAANYILNIFLPEKINQTIKKLAKDNLDRRVTISRIDVNIIKGISLKEVILFEADAKTPYLKVKTIRLVPFYPSLLSNKKLFLSMKIEDGYFMLKRKADNTLNLLEIKAAPQGPTKTLTEKKDSAPYNKEMFFLVRSLAIKDFNLDFVDEAANFRKNFTGINLTADFSSFPEIISNVKWQNSLSANTIYDFKTGKVKSLISIKEIPIEEFAPYFTQIAVKKGNLKNAQITIEGKENYALKIDAKLDNFYAIKEKNEFKGDISTTAQINIEGKNLTYQATGNLAKGFFKPEPGNSRLTSINADFTLNKDKIQLSKIKADLEMAKEETGIKIPIKATAEFNFLASEVFFEAQTNSEISQLITALKNADNDNLAFLKTFSYEGGGNINLKADVKIDLKNNLSKYYIDYGIEKAKFKELENIQAKGFLKNDKLSIEECSFKHKNILWQAKIDVENFSSPHLKANLHSSLLNANVEAKQVKNIIGITNLTIKTKDSQITAEGNFKKNKASLEFTGLGYINLAEIEPLLKIYNVNTGTLSKLNPQGVLNTKFTITGPLKPNEWQIKLAGLSEKLKIYNIEGSNIKLEFYKDKDLLIVSPLVANVADGKMELRTKINKPNQKIVVNLLINDLDLAILRKQLNLKSKNLSGILSLEADFENNSLDLWDKLDGSGKVSIHDGNIWEINFLKGMGEFLFISEFEEIKFEEGYSDLIFKGENIIFENIELKSYQMNLKGKGRISLKGDLNFMLVSEFNPELVSASQGLQKLFTSVLGQNGLAIDLKGTLQHATYKVKPVFLSDLDGFKKVLDGILK